MFYRNTPPSLLTLLVVLQFLFCLIITPPLLSAEIQLPEMGDPSGSLLTPKEEQRLGQAFMRNIRNTEPVVENTLITDYIESLGQRLVSSSTEIGSTFHFFAIDNSQINAFAGPGGYIGVYSGLLNTTQSESELASVLAHEIAHVEQKHLMRTYDALTRLTLPMAALMLAAMLIGSTSNNAQAGAAAAAGIQAGMLQKQINFTRANEQEADRLGIQILAEAGFNPSAMPVFFSRMGKATQIYDQGEVPEFLRTHPITSNRIAEAFSRAKTYAYRQQIDSLGYHLSRVILEVAGSDQPEAIAGEYQSRLKQGRYSNRESIEYGLVLAEQKAHHQKQAMAQIEELIKANPTEPAYRITAAELLSEAAQPAEALKQLETGLEHHPGNLPLTLSYATALLHQNEPGRVITLLERQLSGRADDVRLYKLLSQAAGMTGNLGLGHRYLAEYHYHSGNLEEAKKQLEYALKNRHLDYYESARLAARLKEIRTEINELKEDKQPK